MTNKTVKIQIRSKTLAPDLLLYTLTAVETILISVELARDQLFLIVTLRIDNLTLHTKESSHQP